MKCETCTWYIDREKIAREKHFLHDYRKAMPYSRFCCLGGSAENCIYFKKGDKNVKR